MSKHRGGGGRTFPYVKATLNFLGLTISKNNDSGEYRVNFKDGSESTAYYTPDLEDADSTGIAMYQARQASKPKPSEPVTKTKTCSRGHHWASADWWCPWCDQPGV